MKIRDVQKKLDKTNNRLAMGYEATMDFSLGYLYGLLHSNQIDKKQFNALKKANYESYAGEHDDISYYVDICGNLIELSYDKDDNEIKKVIFKDEQ